MRACVPVFHLGACPKALLHNSAVLKPFTTKVRFKAPRAGTGPITFRALIKVGPANEGEFYHPHEVQMQEGGHQAMPWLLAGVLESCDQACESVGRICDAAEMERNAVSRASLEAAIGAKHLCKMPILADHSSVSPFKTTDNTCWYHEGSGAATNCATVAKPTVKRFCYCVEPAAARRLLGIELIASYLRDDDEGEVKQKQTSQGVPHNPPRWGLRRWSCGSCGSQRLCVCARVCLGPHLPTCGCGRLAHALPTE